MLVLDAAFYQSASAASASACSTGNRQMEALLLSGIHNHFIAVNLENRINRFAFVDEFDLVGLGEFLVQHILRMLLTFYDGNE